TTIKCRERDQINNPQIDAQNSGPHEKVHKACLYNLICCVIDTNGTGEHINSMLTCAQHHYVGENEFCRVVCLRYTPFQCSIDRFFIHLNDTDWSVCDHLCFLFCSNNC